MGKKVYTCCVNRKEGNTGCECIRPPTGRRQPTTSHIIMIYPNKKFRTSDNHIARIVGRACDMAESVIESVITECNRGSVSREEACEVLAGIIAATPSTTPTGNEVADKIVKMWVEQLRNTADYALRILT